MAKWTPNTILEEAKKYINKSDFALKAPGAVKAARKLGVYKEVCQHMKRLEKQEFKRTDWNEETLKIEALKYSSKGEFTSKRNSAVKVAKELGIYDSICEHMNTNYRLWSNEDLVNEALKYNTRSEFQRNSNSAYITARVKGVLEDICVHMKVQHECWTYEKVLSIAKQYTRRVDFQRNDTNAYATAKRNNWVDKVCEHMAPVFNSWTNQELREEALKYEYRVDFQCESKGAYLAAYKRGLLEEVCSHMEYKDGSTQLANEMYMYYIRIDTLDSSLPPIWKIGITRYKDPMRRFKREISAVKTKITVLKTWYFIKGYDAAKAERNVMEEYKEFAYMGDSPLRETKTTEIFNEDILRLEVLNG